MSLLTITILLFVWWFLTSGIKLVKPLYFPSPSSVLRTVAIIHQKIWFHAAATLIRVVVSWFIGSSLGVAVGLVMIKSQIVRAILSPIVEGMRPVPPVALIPLIIVWFGIGESGKLFLSGLACFMVLVVNTIVSAGNVNPIYIQAAKSLGASENKIYLTVILPAIVPELLSGGRIAIALAFAVTVAAEFMGAEYGIGYLIMQASRTLNTEVVLIGTVVIGIESFALDRSLRLATNYITRWTER
ncbi:MAG: ABC transporter permease [Verrucomicrobia bacterium]|nr:ABC transporter permease [Verrucomicrobiota bacterium]